jgi:hypothetical protein
MAQKTSGPDAVHSEITALIAKSLAWVRTHPSFQTWREELTLSAGDIVAINNSFVFRSGVGTRKNEKYLAVVVRKNGDLTIDPVVCEALRLNSDFKLISAKSKNQPMCQELGDAVWSEVKELGKLVFLLVGSVDDTVVLEEAVNDEDFDLVVLDPALNADVEIKGRKILVREVGNEDRVWDAVKHAVGDAKNPQVVEGLRQKVKEVHGPPAGQRQYSPRLQLRLLFSERYVDLSSDDEQPLRAVFPLALSSTINCRDPRGRGMGHAVISVCAA